MKKLILFLILFSHLGVGGLVAQSLNVSGDINTRSTTGQVQMPDGTNPPISTSISSSTVGGRFLIRQNTVSNATSQANNNFDVGSNARSSQTAFIDLFSVDYNTNADVSIDLTNDRITINRTGLYHFEGMIRYLANFSSGSQNPPKASLGFIVGNSPVILTDEVLLETDDESALFSNGYFFEMDRYLEAGQTIKFQVRIAGTNFNTALTSIGISGAGTFIKGHFVKE
jgi:hypothetical protein